MWKKNIGGFYNDETSVFICPTDGLYLFTMSIYTNIGDYISTVLSKDGTHMVSAYSGIEDGNHGVNTILTECLMLQSVWVECYGFEGPIQASIYTSFSGVLIADYA